MNFFFLNSDFKIKNKGKEETIHIHYTKKDWVTEITEKVAIFL